MYLGCLLTLARLFESKKLVRVGNSLYQKSGNQLVRQQDRNDVSELANKAGEQVQQQQASARGDVLRGSSVPRGKGGERGGWKRRRKRRSWRCCVGGGRGAQGEVGGGGGGGGGGGRLDRRGGSWRGYDNLLLVMQLGGMHEDGL
eukprot:749830-Hanusia_phi.AAC.1